MSTPPKRRGTTASPRARTGIDGALHAAHPGALFDETRSYNFEDVRSGLWETVGPDRARRRGLDVFGVTEHNMVFPAKIARWFSPKVDGPIVVGGR